MENREQKLIDIMFEIAMTSRTHADHFNKMGREKHMEWVAYNLKECGFPTTPRGSSWGVLDK